MPPISRARLARIEKTLAADLDATRRVVRLEKIAKDESQHPARRARAFDGIWSAWRAAALASPSKAADFWERARLAAEKAEQMRPNLCEIIRARLDAMRQGAPMPQLTPDPHAKHDPDNQAARLIRERLGALAGAHRRDLQ